MISYAQNFEDVMLWRALKQVNNGFYIDVGAWSPNLDSVTRLFYENGWSGINIEPNPEYHKQYISDRDRDVNLNLAVSDIQGEATIYFVDNPGLSSLDKSIAESHESIGYGVLPTQVCVTTLTKVFEEYASGKDVHFLKIDVEGFEKKVLLGNDWKVFRPWILVIEATLPMSQEESYEDWESILLHSNYLFAYADGLNRFYVASERSNLMPAFQYPPNVFDDIKLARVVELEMQVKELYQQVVSLSYSVNEANNLLQQSENKLLDVESDLLSSKEVSEKYYQIVNGRFWRYTKWLRYFISACRQFSFPKELDIKILLKNILAYSPFIKRVFISVLSRTPKFEKKIRRWFSGESTLDVLATSNQLEKISRRSAIVLAQLERARKKNMRD